MYRAGRGELDQRIARTTAAIDHGDHLREVDDQLAGEEHQLRAMLGAIELAIVMREHRDSELSLARLWAILRGNRDVERIETLIEQADRAILAAALEHQLEQVRQQRRDVAADLAKVDDARDHLEALLVEKENWLARIGAPNAAEALALAERIGHWRALEEALETAVRIAYEAQNEMRQAIVQLEDSQDPRSRRDGVGSSKEGQLAQAAAHAGIADGYLRRLAIELAAIAGFCERLKIALPPFVVERARGALTADIIQQRGWRGLRINEVKVSETDLRREAQWVSQAITAARELRQNAGLEVQQLLERRAHLLSS